MKFIREFSDDIIIESIVDEETNKKSWYIKGVTLQSEIKNKNGRIYPKPILKDAVNTYIENHLKKNTVQSLGEMNHPDIKPYVVNMENATHKFVDISENNNDFITKAKILDTPKGLIVQNLLRENIKIGISSRGFGELKEDNGTKIVKQFELITAGDLVSNPSAPDAFVQGVMEDAEWIYENGCYVQKECEIEQQIDENKQIIDEMFSKVDKGEIQKVLSTIWEDYLKTLFLK